MKLTTNVNTYDLTKRTHVMGILNVTPDSFSDGGRYVDEESAIRQAKFMEHDGADMIDIGGESTRPDHQSILADEEIKRVVPMIKAVKNHVNIPISVDTYKAATAEAAIEAGASIINDIWGAKQDPEIAGVAASHHVPIILMHNRKNKNYTSIIEDMKRDLSESIDIALNAGVAKENIILDPGIGFAKTMADNFTVMNHLEELTNLGFPLLLATSRKRFIGTVLDVPPEERDIGTGATTCLGITKGAHIVRVHNVKTNVQLAKMMDRMLQS